MDHCILPYHYFIMTRLIWTSRFKYFIYSPTSITFFHWPDMSASCNSAMDFSLGSMFSFRETFAIIEVMLSTFIQFSHIFRIRLLYSQYFSAYPNTKYCARFKVLGIHLRDEYFSICEVINLKGFLLRNLRRFYLNCLTSSFYLKPTGVPVDFK